MAAYFNRMFVAVLFELFHYFSAETNEMALWLSKNGRSGIMLESSLWMKEEWRYWSVSKSMFLGIVTFQLECSFENDLH